MLPTFINFLSLILSASAFWGVVIHDLRLDRAAMAALATPSSVVEYDTPARPLTFESHPHTERSAFGQAMSVYQRAATPGIQPRSERKHLMQKYAPKGHHAFDNYNLPLV